MHKISSPDCEWSFLVEIVRKLFQTFRNIGSHITLLLNILRTPTDTLAFALQLIALQLHRTRQSNGTPRTIFLSLQQDFRCCLKPATTFCRIHQRDKHTRIERTSTTEKIYRRKGILNLFISASRQDNFPESALLQLRVEISKVNGIVHCRLLPRY